MNIRDAISAKAIASYHTEHASNAIPYLGTAMFPAAKKMGLDLAWIKTASGLPVSLSPSAFDAKSTLRSRGDFSIDQTKMAFFRESMIVSEQDEQEIMRVQDLNDPYAQEVVRHIFNDAATLIDAAMVVPERMIWQLLAPATGTPGINITANGATYVYNYDPQGTFVANNYKALSGTSLWSASATCDPMQDVSDAIDKVEELTGERIAHIIMNKVTLNALKKSAAMHSYILAQNQTANIFMNTARVNEAMTNELGVNIVEYNKQYKDEAGVAHKFLPDGYVVFVPEGTLGKTWYGTTPEERTLMGSGEADVAVVNTGVAVAVTTTNDPVNTKTTASEIVLPSFERMNSVFCMKVL